MAKVTDDKLTLIEVCAVLRITRSTFYEWRQKGRAPKCTPLPNGSLRIERADFEAWYQALGEDAA